MANKVKKVLQLQSTDQAKLVKLSIRTIFTQISRAIKRFCYLEQDEKDLLGEAAMTNAYNISHNVQDFLFFRGYKWTGMQKSKKKKKKKKCS